MCLEKQQRKAIIIIFFLILIKLEKSDRLKGRFFWYEMDISIMVNFRTFGENKKENESFDKRYSHII
ncbi:hypothetical protein A499_08974 [Niallia nealsonii AAU1]|nr:hypothetical protein A499_08974 [Niallia nealsonii AAU1]